MQITPFQFENHNVRVVTDETGEPLFVGKDVCAALGYANHSDAMNKHCKGVAKRYPLQTAGGVQDVRVLSEPDVLRLIVSSQLPGAQAFERLLFEDILPAIRKTGRYAAPGSVPVPSAITPVKEFEALFGVARLIGLDHNAAAFSANQATVALTGTNVLRLLGAEQLTAENQHAMFYTPTELGERLGVSGRKFNMLLAEAGLQVKQGEQWAPLPAAEGFFRLIDSSKRHSNGAMVQQLKWASNVLQLVQPEAA